ncbi:MAG: trehalose-phosphatase [Candidatus Omnitrophica bacterium CG1_02_49_10]|nr:MAG: trehalose-phosphatase [Candidatus Omnitrophica bacterium CG1_02_49_10]
MTRYLFGDWDKVSERINASGRTLLLFDYDGTLTPITSSPGEAVFPTGTKQALAALARLGFTVGVISGRSIRDLKSIVGVKGIYYAGNHGLEIEGPGIDYIHAVSSLHIKALRDITGELKERFLDIKGVIIEDKGLSVSVHYRMANGPDILKVKKIFRDIVSPYIDSRKVGRFEGKKVLELRPPTKWDKGSAVKAIKRLIISEDTGSRAGDYCVMYAGDDVTDEDAFRVLGRNDISVRVGKKRSSKAAYHLEDTGEVVEFLYRLKRLG